jgi:hypothetical protein
MQCTNDVNRICEIITAYRREIFLDLTPQRLVDGSRHSEETGFLT